jgi:hypothetical protein
LQRVIAASPISPASPLSWRSLTIRASCSPLDRPPSRRRNPNADNLDRPIASHHVALCYCKPSADDLSQHAPAENMAMNELLLVDAKPAAGEQL